MYHYNLKLHEAQEFVAKHHRHSQPLKRHIFSIGAFEYLHGEGNLLGIVTVDRCSSKWSKRRDHLEIRRLCIAPGAKSNTASFLLGKAKQACYAMGYQVIITYTKPRESGSSLLASGFWLQKAKWRKGNPQNSAGLLLQWVAVSNKQPSDEDRAWTKDVLNQIKEGTA